jgi:hypothetical protein
MVNRGQGGFLARISENGVENKTMILLSAKENHMQGGRKI